MNFSDIQATVAKDFDAVNTLIMEQLSSNVPLIGEVGSYIINSGGKSPRPIKKRTTVSHGV